MKVTIAYRVDLEDVPTEVARLLENVSSTLTACSVVSDGMRDQDGISDTMLQDLALLSAKVEEARVSLDDISGIATGYLAAITNSNTQSTEKESDHIDRSEKNASN